ncbi:MAG: nickel pincer cofactor biosynthesis protein LarB [Magnetococcales bacterium]|nr:nickel pincer cofactor biosynthesis protein LarB [Magnetococcales bacterium]
MSISWLQQLLEQVAAQHLSVPEALSQLQRWPTEPVCSPHGEVIARLDRHRALRHGFPEVVLAEGKKMTHLVQIVETILGRPHAQSDSLLITRVSASRRRRLQQQFPTLQARERCLFYKPLRPSTDPPPSDSKSGLVAVICAGTSDIPVAEEAALTAELLGADVETHYDAGVAGLHRLLATDLLYRASVFIVVAGMEGALPSVVGGLVNKPVIAVPTSTGYGASLKGMSALLGMLNSCVANVSVVNIDNGFSAGYIAGLIVGLISSKSIR